MNKNFDEYDDNPLNEKTFAELGIIRASDIDFMTLLLYVRDQLQRTGLDLCGDAARDAKRTAGDIRGGLACKVAAMYVNLAINSVLRAMTFKKAR